MHAHQIMLLAYGPGQHGRLAAADNGLCDAERWRTDHGKRPVHHRVWLALASHGSGHPGLTPPGIGG
jgi:hypothetical protein